MEFETAIHALCDAGVDFVLVGGVSANLYGGSRVSYDLDICYSRRRENLRKLAAALAPFHPYPKEFPAGLPFVWDEVTLGNGGLFTLDTDLGGIDLLAEIAGVGTYDEAISQSVKMSVYGREVNNLNLRALIASKLAAGRPKDLGDVAELEAIREATEPSKAQPAE